MAGISLNELASKLAQPLIQGSTPLTGKSKLDYLGMDSDDGDSATVATGDDIDAVQKSVDGVKKGVDSLKTDMSNLKGEVSNQGANISANANNIATNTTNIKALQTDVSTLKGKVNDQQTAIDDNKNNIATNTADIAQLKKGGGQTNPLKLITSIPDLSSGTNIDPSTVTSPWVTKTVIVQLFKKGEAFDSDPLPNLTIDTPLSGSGVGLSLNQVYGVGDFKVIMELEYQQWISPLPWYYFRFPQPYQLRVNRLVVGYNGVVEDHFTGYGGGTITVGTQLKYGGEWAYVHANYSWHEFHLPHFKQDINDIEIDYTDTDGKNYNSYSPVLALIPTGAWTATYHAGMWILDTTGGSGGVYIVIYKGPLMVAKNSSNGSSLSTNRYLYLGSIYDFNGYNGYNLLCDNGNKTIADLTKFVNVKR